MIKKTLRKVVFIVCTFMLITAVGLACSRPEPGILGQDVPPQPQPASKPTPEELVPRITIQELVTKMDGGANIVIVDARPEAEYDAGHVKGAVSAPLSIIFEGKWTPPPGKEVIIYCS